MPTYVKSGGGSFSKGLSFFVSKEKYVWFFKYFALFIIFCFIISAWGKTFTQEGINPFPMLDATIGTVINADMIVYNAVHSLMIPNVTTWFYFKSLLVILGGIYLVIWWFAVIEKYIVKGFMAQDQPQVTVLLLWSFFIFLALGIIYNCLLLILTHYQFDNNNFWVATKNLVWLIFPFKGLVSLVTHYDVWLKPIADRVTSIFSNEVEPAKTLSKLVGKIGN